jgi:hypothetical protein
MSAGEPMSGLIVLGIMGIWILVLVPMWLNRHEADNATRSMDSFSTAMRVLSRRTPARTYGADRYVVMPRRDNLGITVDNQPNANAGRRLLRLPGRRAVPVGSGRARLLARRRRMLLAFAALTIGLAGSAASGFTSWWLELAAFLGGAGYLVHLRNEAIRAAELRQRRTARLARAAAGPLTFGEQPVAREYRTGREVWASVGAAGGVDVTGVAAASASGTENGSRWEPVPVPLPTYVSKPVVQRPAAAAPRADVESGTIDLTQPGAWTDSQVDVRHLLLDETGSGTIAASSRAGSHVIDLEDDELDLILERRRAVGD